MDRLIFQPAAEGLILDFGGTIDTNGCHWGKMLWHGYQDENMPVDETQFRDAYVYAERVLGANPIIQTSYTFYKTLDIKIGIEMEWLCATGAWDADEAMFKAKRHAVLENVYGRAKEITARNKQVLLQLRERYPMVLVSNFYGNLKEVLDEFQLSDGLFQSVIESAVVGIRKPDARLFKLGVKALGCEPKECVSIGDSYYKDIQPSAKIGCKTVWLKGEGWTDKTYDEALPDAVITDFQDLLSLL